MDGYQKSLQDGEGEERSNIKNSFFFFYWIQEGRGMVSSFKICSVPLSTHFGNCIFLLDQLQIH